MKRFLSMFALSILILSSLTAAAPVPSPTFTLAGPEELLTLNDPQAPPPTITMNVGETLTVRVEVTATSEQPFLFAQALPSFQFVGKGVVAVQGGDHVGRGNFAALEITYQAKSPTSRMPNGAAPVHFVAGVRYPGGYVAVQDYLFNVIVP